jgi:HAD superfamily hydrolase (TIGR01490 family)
LKIAMGISIFDMDRTITRRGTWVPWLVFWVRREAPWRVLLLPGLGLALLAYTLKLIDRGRLKELGHRLMMGRRVARPRLQAAAEAYAERVLAENVYPQALQQLEADRAEGQRLVLATASNGFYVAAIAEKLGIADVIATPPQWEDDRLRHRLGGENCYGAAKRLLVEGWMAREAVVGQPLRVYSDHESDLPLFELAVESGGEAVATNASAALRAVALARGWRALTWGKAARSWFERA